MGRVGQAALRARCHLLPDHRRGGYAVEGGGDVDVRDGGRAGGRGGTGCALAPATLALYNRHAGQEHDTGSSTAASGASGPLLALSGPSTSKRTAPCAPSASGELETAVAGEVLDARRRAPSRCRRRRGPAGCAPSATPRAFFLGDWEASRRFTERRWTDQRRDLIRVRPASSQQQRPPDEVQDVFIGRLPSPAGVQPGTISCSPLASSRVHDENGDARHACSRCGAYGSPWGFPSRRSRGTDSAREGSWRGGGLPRRMRAASAGASRGRYSFVGRSLGQSQGRVPLQLAATAVLPGHDIVKMTRTSDVRRRVPRASPPDPGAQVRSDRPARHRSLPARARSRIVRHLEAVPAQHGGLRLLGDRVEGHL